MSYDLKRPGGLDYLPCRYGASKLLFRGPKRNLEEPFVAFLGGTETYGKFIKEPFPALVEQELAKTCVNFGQVNAGIDAFTQDPFIIDACAKAHTTVVQIVGAQNMTNRFYAVHPRRNDRFISTSTLLKTIYREVDFSEFHFTRHMLGRLYDVSPDRFETVRMELSQAWLARMRLLLKQIRGRSILLWFANQSPPGEADFLEEGIGQDPLFVTREMMTEISPFATAVVEVLPSQEARAQGTEGMYYSDLEEPAAAEMMSPKAHEEAADAVLDALTNLE